MHFLMGLPSASALVQATALNALAACSPAAPPEAAGAAGTASTATMTAMIDATFTCRPAFKYNF